MVPIRVDPSQPIYRQVVEAYAASIARGDLEGGTPLPSVRALAEELRVNVNTVQKAYRELEAMGLIQARPGLGVFVHPTEEAARAYRERQVRGIVERFVADLAAYGVSPEDATGLIAAETRGKEPGRDSLANGH